MDCQEVHKLKETYVDGRLAESQRQRLEAHLATCIHCAARVALAQRVQQELGSTLRQAIGEPHLSLAAESRIRARLWEAVEPAPSQAWAWRPRATWLRGIAWGGASVLALAAVIALILVIGPLLTLPLPATQRAFITPPAEETLVPPSTALALLQATQTPVPTPRPPTSTPMPTQAGPALSPTPAEPVATRRVPTATTPTAPALTRPATAVPTASPASPQTPPTAASVTPSAIIAGIGTPTARVTWKQYLPGEPVTCVVQHGQAVWAGTADGQVVRLNTVTDELTRHTLSPGIAVTGLTVDAAGHVWAATRGQGVFVLAATDVASGTTWMPHTAARTGLPSDVVHALAVDAAGGVWCGTAGGTVSRLAPASVDARSAWQSFAAPANGTADTQVTALAADAAGVIWVGVRGRYSAETATYSGGLYRLRTDGSPLWEKSLSSDVGIVQAIFVRPDGRLWVATSPTGDVSNPHARGGGVVVWDGKGWTLYEALGAGMPSRRVTDVVVDARGRAWIATDRGLIIYEGTQHTLYQTTNAGLASDHVYDIALDGAGGAWLATEGGLCRVQEW